MNRKHESQNLRKEPRGAKTNHPYLGQILGHMSLTYDCCMISECPSRAEVVFSSHREAVSAEKCQMQR